MAEQAKAVASSRLHFKLTDGSGTPLTYTFKLIGVPTFSHNLPQSTEALMGQQGGISVIEALIHNGVTGPGEFIMVIALQDPGNTTDATAIEWVRQMEIDTYSGGLATFTSTNPLPLGGKGCAIGTLTFENVGASNADQTFVADMAVDKVGASQIINGAICHEVKFMVVEGWTKAAA